MRAVIEREQPDVVFNLATKALLYSFFNPAGACRVNLDIALALCELQRHGAFGKLVHVSSSEVYGTARSVPMDEDHPLLAETTYAAGKAAADLAVASYVRMFGIDAVTVRPFNNYGPRQNAGDVRGGHPRHGASGSSPGCHRSSTATDLQTRDFIFVADTVDAMLRIAAARRSARCSPQRRQWHRDRHRRPRATSGGAGRVGRRASSVTRNGPPMCVATGPTSPQPRS